MILLNVNMTKYVWKVYRRWSGPRPIEIDGIEHRPQNGKEESLIDSEEEKDGSDSTEFDNDLEKTKI